MTRSKTITLATVLALPVVAITLAGCGGGGTSGGSVSPPKTSGGQPATVGVVNTGLGKVLVNSKGRTLYLFQKDTGSMSTCSGACAANWPPLLANGKPSIGSGANASLVGTSTRSDGKTQVTYNGHPVYTFSGDAKAGDTNGEGVNAFGGNWYALSGAGTKVSGSSNSGGSGYGYG
jgi:predicted lipoprotein with Yx(FWY)xxD motif